MCACALGPGASGGSVGEAKDEARVGLHVRLPGDVDAVADGEQLPNTPDATHPCQRASLAVPVLLACAWPARRCSCTNCIFAGSGLEKTRGQGRTHLTESWFSFVDPLEIWWKTESNEKFAGTIQRKLFRVAPDMSPGPRLESANVRPKKCELFFRVRLGQPGFAHPGIPVHCLHHFKGSLTSATQIY